MKKYIVILLLFTAFLGHAQGGPKVDVVKFRGEVTSTVRNSFDVPTGEHWLIFNVTTGQLEIGDEDEVWESVGSGLQEGTNYVPSGVTIYESIANGIAINSAGEVGGRRIIIQGGDQPDFAQLILDDNTITSNLSISDIDNGSNAILPTKEWVVAEIAATESTPSDDSVTSAKIVDGTIQSVDISDGAITTNKIDDESITASKIPDDGIPVVKIAPSTTNGQVLTTVGGASVWATPSGGGGFSPTITSPQNNQVLGYNGTEWINTFTNGQANGISITDAAGNFAATNVEDALTELAGASSTVNTNTSFVPIATSRELTDADIKGPQQQSVVIEVSGTRTLTLGDAISHQKHFVIRSPFETDSVIVVPEAGFTFKGIYANNSKVQGNTIGVTYKNWEGVTWIRNGNVYEFTGNANENVAICTPDPNNIYNLADAASDPYCNEANAVSTGWDMFNSNATISAVSTDLDATGSFVLRGTNTAGGAVSYMSYRWSATAGKTYTITFRAKTTQGSNVRFTAWQNMTGGPSSVIPTSTYQTYTYNVTVTATGIAEMRFYASANTSGVLGDNFFISQMDIIATN